ncbi:MAG TPA: cation-translocating P-type ATPase [Waterburya sp.]|jgi:Ca2+-transporting ATPase
MVTRNVSDSASTFPKGDRTLPYQGLSSEQVKVNRQTYGANVLTPPERNPWWTLFLEKFEDPVIRILMIAAVVAISVGLVEGEYVEGLGIIVAILLATIIAFVNEYKASQQFDILNQVYDEVSVKVIRDGSFASIPRKELVVGDIVYVEQGEEVPADGDILEGVSLYIDQSKITGESEPIKKFARTNPEVDEKQETTYPAFKIYRGTIVDQGHAFYELTAVGDQTEIGKVATVVATVETGEKTPLSIQLERLSKLIGVVGLFFSGLTFVALLMRGFATRELSLTFHQSYFVGLLIVSVLVTLVRVWLPVVYDGFDLIGADIEPPNWLENESWAGWLKTIGLGLGLLMVGMMTGYLLGLMPADGYSWLPNNVGRTLLHYFMVAVTIIVVAVPEGLAMSVTLSLAYSMKKMAASNNLVRRMHACETIGAATVICSDKTGTLTQNQMRVYDVNFPCLNSQPLELEYSQALIAEAIAANSTADLEKKPLCAPNPIGNPTEGALLLWLDSQDIDYIPYRNNFQIQLRLPFSTQKKYMGTLGISSVTDSRLLYIKGAPELILERCSQILTENGPLSLPAGTPHSTNIHTATAPLPSAEPDGTQTAVCGAPLLTSLRDKASILTALKDYQQRGMRTLGLAYQEVSQTVAESDLDQIDHHLTWLGFVAISDPLRTDVSEAIHACLAAGIQVKIITGDSPETVQEIARQIGLWQEEDTHRRYLHLTGQEFHQLSEDEAKLAVQELKVLSRACPFDKLRLVKLLQENGHIVAVTGDGTNDAAALKHAHVGLAMGSGTAIAKEASDIILLDDSFRSIVNAVVWGRSLYENIQRFILFQLTINVGALGIALLGPFIGVALPLTVTQMLWVNLIMDTFAALALATEPPHWSVMERFPRDPDAFIVSKSMAQNIFTTGACFLIFLVGLLLYIRQDETISNYELSVFFAIFVMFQFWNLFNARCLGLKQSAFSELSKNKNFLVIAATIFVGQILIIQFGGSVFRTVPLSLPDWISIIGGTSVVLWAGELWRWILRFKLRKNRGDCEQISVNC